MISSTEALSLTEVPRSLVVVGAGYIGLELGTAFAKMGAAVTVVEAQPRILPQYDAELTRPVGKRLRELGIDGADRRQGERSSRPKDGRARRSSGGRYRR